MNHSGFSFGTKSRKLGIIILWILIGLVFLAFTQRNIIWVAQNGIVRDQSYDFKLFYGGSFDFLQGGNPYKQTANLPFERTNDTNGNSLVGALFFLLFVPFNITVAAAIWNVISLLLFGLGLSYLWRVYRDKLPEQWHWRAFLVLVIYISYPIVETLELSSWGMILAFLDFATWYYARKNKDWQAGIFLGLAAALRWHAFPLILYFIVKKRWKAAGSSILTIAISNLIALPIFGLNNLLEFLYFVLGRTSSDRKTGGDASLRAFFARIFLFLDEGGIDLKSLIPVFWIISSIIILGLTLWSCLKLEYDYAFSLCLVTGLLIIPSSWTHYQMALLLPMIVVYRNKTWPVIYTFLLWLSFEHLIPFRTIIEFNGLLVFGSIWPVLYTSFMQITFGLLLPYEIFNSFNFGLHYAISGTLLTLTVFSLYYPLLPVTKASVNHQEL